MSISIGYDPTEWRSSDRQSQYKPTKDLTAGDIVVIKREPYRIHEITPRPHINWPEEYLAAWERSGRPDPEGWWHRPFVLILSREDALESKKRRHCIAAGSRFWTVLPEHYAVCRLCGELPPCRHEHTETVMEHASARMAEAMAILPGFCHHCHEPITRRQGSVRFEGENLIRPDLGNNSAIREAILDKRAARDVERMVANLEAEAERLRQIAADVRKELRPAVAVGA